MDSNDPDLKEKIQVLQDQHTVVSANIVKLRQISELAQKTLHSPHPPSDLELAISELESSMDAQAALILRLKTIGR